jgi:glycosyltransferase involved in cell wall biosynthesis
VISVILPSHNPSSTLLERTRQGLVAQTIDRKAWELVIIDNGGKPGNALQSADWSWHPSIRLIEEPHLGLTFARCRGIREAQGDVLLFVDDDNVLAPDFLARAQELMEQHGTVGAAGGRSLPEYLEPPPAWLPSPPSGLGLRDLGDTNQVSGYETDERGQRRYPSCAPIGAGLVLRRAAAIQYLHALETAREPITDRRGSDLTSGGDNDIVMTVLDHGWQVAYFASLRLTHLIPARRLTAEYQAALAEGIYRSWVKVLSRHGIRPWHAIAPWTAPLRKWKSWFRTRAWTGPAERIKWRAACGLIDGQADLSRKRSMSS